MNNLLPTAAGIMFLCGSRVLLLRRGENAPDFAGYWAFAGGKVEDGESDEAAARREVLEETGLDYQDGLSLHSVNNGFITFITTINTEFTPQLNSEHSEFMWAEMDALPDNMHPDALASILAPSIDEMQVAQAMVDGKLSSPQRLGEMWLFNIRITGTGTAYRTTLDEFTYRPPENYLNNAFLARCLGLPVIFEHPEEISLNSQEYANRNVGSIMLPYINDAAQEVWGIARIYDQDTITILRNERMSTSPTVFFRPEAGSETHVFEDGQEILIEGIPSTVDHVALCEVGVWDKGLTPSGVKSDNVGVSSMTEEEMRAKAEAEAKKEEKRGDSAEAEEEKKKADSDGDSAPAWFSTAMSAFSKRLDALEGTKKADSDDKKEEDKKADSDEKKEDDKKEEKKADSDVQKRADSDVSVMRAEMEALRRSMPRDLSDAERNEISATQMRADSVMNMMGEGRAPFPLNGETPMSYRRRLAAKFKPFSPDWKDVDISALADSAAFSIAERTIYADAEKAAAAPAVAQVGQVRQIIKADSAGRQVSMFVGDVDAVWAPFKAPSKRVTMINKD